MLNADLPFMGVWQIWKPPVGSTAPCFSNIACFLCQTDPSDPTDQSAKNRLVISLDENPVTDAEWVVTGVCIPNLSRSEL